MTKAISIYFSTRIYEAAYHVPRPYPSFHICDAVSITPKTGIFTESSPNKHIKARRIERLKYASGSSDED